MHPIYGESSSDDGSSEEEEEEEGGSAAADCSPPSHEPQPCLFQQLAERIGSRALLPAASLHGVPLLSHQPRCSGGAPLIPVRVSHGGARLALAPAVPRARGGGSGGGSVHCGRQAAEAVERPRSVTSVCNNITL